MDTSADQAAPSVTALSNLICASLTEDPYGVTQRDIPKVLEAFVRFLSALKSLSADLEAAADAVAGGQDEKDRARRMVEKEVGEVEDGESRFAINWPNLKSDCRTWLQSLLLSHSTTRGYEGDLDRICRISRRI